MKRVVAILALMYFVLFCGAQTSRQQGMLVRIPAGFYSASEFTDFTLPMQRAYAAGFINGLFVSTVFQADERALTGIERCLRGMTDDEVAAIIAKYVKEQPENWDLDLDVESLNAITQFCPALKKRMK